MKFLDTRQLTKEEFDKYINRMVVLNILSQKNNNQIKTSARFNMLSSEIYQSPRFWDNLTKYGISHDNKDYVLESLLGSTVNTLIGGKIDFNDSFHMTNIVRQYLGIPMIVTEDEDD